MNIREKVLEAYDTLRLEIENDIVKDAFIDNVRYGRNWVSIDIRVILSDDFELEYTVNESEPLLC